MLCIYWLALKLEMQPFPISDRFCWEAVAVCERESSRVPLPVLRVSPALSAYRQRWPSDHFSPLDVELVGWPHFMIEATQKCQARPSAYSWCVGPNFCRKCVFSHSGWVGCGTWSDLQARLCSFCRACPSLVGKSTSSSLALLWVSIYLFNLSLL